MKGNRELQRVVSNVGIFLHRNAPIILTCLGAAGVVATTITAVNATPKAIKRLEAAKEKKGEELTNLEKVQATYTSYIPSAMIGAATITCIFGASALNKRQQAALCSAYALVDGAFKEYREKLIELHGKEIDEEVRTAIARQHSDYHQIDLDIPDQKLLFYEPNSGKFFEKYEREIMDAEYHLNRNFVMRGYSPLNELYEFLGLPTTEEGDRCGWTVDDGYYWIDFEHYPKTNARGTTYYVIDTVFAPSDEYMCGWE